MTQPAFKKKKFNEGLITAVAVGGFLIILGVVFGLTPGVAQKAWDFVRDFTVHGFPFADGAIILPAPAHPSAHMDFYSALLAFDLGIGALQVAILAARVVLHSSLKRIAETVGNAVFWFGAAVATQMYLMLGTLEGWFTYWAAIIIVVGLSLIARGLIHFVAWLTRKNKYGHH